QVEGVLVGSAGVGNRLVIYQAEAYRILAQLKRQQDDVFWRRIWEKLQLARPCSASEPNPICDPETQESGEFGEGAGIEMDRQVAVHVSGEHHREVPPFSSSERAANRLARRIAREGLTATFELEGGIWHCSWRKTEDRSLLSSGTGQTRALAICRSILNLDLGRIRPNVSATPG